MAHQAGAYPGFCSMKRLGLFLLPPGWDASPSQGYPPALSSPVPIYTPGWRGTVRVKCLVPEHNTMSPARARTRTTCSGVERTNHEATAPPTGSVCFNIISEISIEVIHASAFLSYTKATIFFLITSKVKLLNSGHPSDRAER